MKTIRFLAAGLLVITGVWHLTLFFKAVDDPASLPLLVFGVIYALIGILLFTPKKLWVYLGLAFPLIGMTTAAIKLGIKSFDTTMWILILIDVAVVGCCVYLILNRKKAS
jgi:hypothetical protein